MLEIIKVKTLYDNTLKYYKIDADLQLYKGMFLIAMTCFGEDIVEVVCPIKKSISEQEWEDIVARDKKNSHFSFEPYVLRIAEDYEYEKYKNNIKKAEEQISVFQQKIKEHNIDMKIVQLYYTFLKDRLICVYTASQRVDFRDLVKDLGSYYKQRIELFQISLRDMFSTMKDQYSICGRPLCCALTCSVNNKGQRKNVKSVKMLGICGKVKCCLQFDEVDKYYLR